MGAGNVECPVRGCHRDRGFFFVSCLRSVVGRGGSSVFVEPPVQISDPVQDRASDTYEFWTTAGPPEFRKSSAGEASVVGGSCCLYRGALWDELGHLDRPLGLPKNDEAKLALENLRSERIFQQMSQGLN